MTEIREAIEMMIAHMDFYCEEMTVYGAEMEYGIHTHSDSCSCECEHCEFRLAIEALEHMLES